MPSTCTKDSNNQILNIKFVFFPLRFNVLLFFSQGILWSCWTWNVEWTQNVWYQVHTGRRYDKYW